MKLHLPLSLRKCLLLICATTAATTAWGGGMHSDINILTYADFGQNKGRYAVDGNVNALLDAIRLKDGGIKIEYQVVGKDPYIIDYYQGMINYSATADIGAYNAISPTFIATVLHNGSQNGSFAEKIIGSAHAINYEGIDIRGSNVYRLAPDNGNGGQYDYMIQRQSKLITDVTWNPVSSFTGDISTMNGGLLYHSGGGVMSVWNEDTDSRENVYGPYQYVTGGIIKIDGAQQHPNTTNLSFHQNPNYGNGVGATPQHPMPNCIHGGDSGSPVFIYNEQTKQYEYIAAQQSASGNSYGQARGNAQWSHATMKSFNAHVDLSSATTVYLGAIETEGESYTDNKGNSSTLYYGIATDANNNALATYNGVQTGLNTWKDLSGIKDEQTWYAYGTGYLERTDTELFHNNNLVFTSSHSATDIVLNATVDLGVGYVEFNRDDALSGKASYTIRSEEGKGYLLNSAGYVINEGAEVHVKLNNPENYMREWRKTGEGSLYIDGTGDTNALLALGGKGATYLQQTGGHAAYNVLASSGAKVVIADTSQIERDFTFGAGGGTLDMNGSSMDWHTSNTDVSADGFSINALTEEAIITNEGETASRLTFKTDGNQTYLGSFKDSATGALQIDYQGGGTWTLNSIHTDLTKHADSGLTVSNGKVIFSGINTVHGMGTTDEGRHINRLLREDDWHYADAAMNVTVASGAGFELGSHARLSGTVTVDSGATYTMREGVKHRMEYVEGGFNEEDTYAWEAYYGHKGDTVLNGTLNVEFSEGTTANTTYAGNISGSGNMTVDAADGSLTLSGTNTFTGSREVARGTLIAAHEAAAGSGKWVVGEQAVFALQGADATTALSHVDSSSTGVLALTQNTSKVSTAGHTNLIIGALEGTTIQYGENGTRETLDAVDGAWRLGGGGGELVVNYALTGDNKLLLGNEYTKGVVNLTNAGNNFTGGIHFMGSGVTLKYTEAALRNVSMDLTYGNRVAMSNLLSLVTRTSDGILLQYEGNQNLDFRGKDALFLGSDADLTYSGKLTVADGQAYRFSASGGTLTVDSSIGGAHDLVVDAQTYSGGTVQLNNVSNLTGNVTVMGYDVTKTQLHEGDITLKLTQDNVLDSAASVTLKAGATLNIGNTTQRINNFTSEAGSVLTGYRKSSNSDPNSSILHLTIDSMSDIKGKVNVDVIHKYGSNTLELNNGLTATSNLQYRSLIVEEGDVILTEAYSKPGNVNIRGNTLKLNGKNFYQGSISAENGATIDCTSSGSTIGGFAYIYATKGTVTMTNGTNDVTVSGHIGAYEGATLILQGSGKWTLSGSDYNDGGTLRVEDCEQITFSHGTNSTSTSDANLSPHTKKVFIKGILDLSDEVTKLQSASKAYVQELRFDTLKLNGQDITLEETTYQAAWRIKDIRANDNTTVTWNTTHTTESTYRLSVYDPINDLTNYVNVNETNSSRLILEGENSFTGKIIANRTSNGAAYNSYVELAHDRALQHGTLELNGYAGSTMALAVNTDNARIHGLTGNEHSLAYSGASSRINLTSAPTGDGKNTLTIIGSGNYEYKGAVNGLSIAMNGTGTQTFSGSDIKAQNISALKGNLVFSSAPTVADTVTIAQGATLKLGDSFSLNAGQTLALVAGENAGQATLNSALILNGGTLSFDGTVLNNETSLLDGSYSFGENVGSQNISFTNSHLLKDGQTYLLLSGADWSNREVALSGLPEYLHGTFSYDNNSLWVTLGVAEGFSEWKENYGVFNEGDTVVFRDSSYTKELNFADTTSVAELRFTNGSTYTFAGKDVSLSNALSIESGSLILHNKLTAADYAAAEGALEIAADGEFVSETIYSGKAEMNNITGEGTLSIRLSSTDENGAVTYTNTLAVDADFNGTTQIQSGNLTLDNSSSFGKTLKMADGVNVQLSSATATPGNLILDGSTEIDQQGNTFTVNGKVSGEDGIWNRKGSGSLIFNDSVSLEALNIDSEGTTNTFNGEATINSIGLKNNTTLSGKGTLTTNNLGLTQGHTLTVDNLTVTDAGERTLNWNGKTNSTLALKNNATLDTRNTHFNVTGTLNIGGDGADGEMFVNGISLANESEMFVTSTSKLVIGKGATMVITGEKAGGLDGDFALSNYGEQNILSNTQPSSINVSGTLTSNAAMTLMHNHANVNVENGGKFNLLKGLTLTGACKGNLNTSNPAQAYATLNINDGGRINAAGGSPHSSLIVNLNMGSTLGSIGEAETTVAYTNDMTLGTSNKQGTVTIDTAAHTVDKDFNVVRLSDKGVTVDISNASIAASSNTALEVIGSGTLNHKNAFNNALSISVQKGATLSVNDADQKLNTATDIYDGTLELRATTVDGEKARVTIIGSGTIRATGGESTLAATTTLDERATVSYDVASGSTLKSTGNLVSIGDTGIIKTGGGKLQLNNEANAIANIQVEAGELNMHGAANYDLYNLQAAASASLSFLVGAAGDEPSEANVRVVGTADFGSEAQLNANLTLATGAVLNVAENGLAMGSTLTLQEGVLLGDSTLARVQSLREGESTTLFSGVDGLTLGNTEYTTISTEDSILASPYFSNLSNNYVLSYTETDNGSSLNITMMSAAVPEPTTTTLSLLALAALAARRRRK